MWRQHVVENQFLTREEQQRQSHASSTTTTSHSHVPSTTTTSSSHYAPRQSHSRCHRDIDHDDDKVRQLPFTAQHDMSDDTTIRASKNNLARQGDDLYWTRKLHAVESSDSSRYLSSCTAYILTHTHKCFLSNIPSIDRYR